MSDSRIKRTELNGGVRGAVRLNGRLMVPACMDCEEPSKCIVMGCGHAMVAKMKELRCSSTFGDINCCQDAGHSGPHGNFAEGGARITWEWPHGR